MFFIGCTNKKPAFHFEIDKSIADKVKKKIRELDTDENRNSQMSKLGYFYIQTKEKYYENGKLAKSYKDENQLRAFYTEVGNTDTTLLAVHPSYWSNSSPIVYFYRDTFSVMLSVYTHENGDNRYALKKTDSLVDHIKLNPQCYELIISEKPDLKKKNVIYGYIRVKSEPFLDKRVGLNTFLVNEKSMYFRAVYWNGKDR